MANGNFAGGTGTPQDPYLIEDAQDLDAIRKKLTASYKLISDIDLSTFQSNDGWIPIGKTDIYSEKCDSFKGNLYGNGHIIKNLYINATKSTTRDFLYLGLIGKTEGNYTISDISMRNVNIISNKHYVGAIVGYCSNDSTLAGNISRCSVYGRIEGNTYVGGITGFFRLATMSNCYSAAYIKGSSNVGGLIGRTSGTSTVDAVVQYSYANGFIDSPYTEGGIIGALEWGLKVTSCFYDVDSTGKSSGQGEGKTTQYMKDVSTFAGWDKAIWRLVQGQYPKLYFEPINMSLLDCQGEYKKWVPASPEIKPYSPSTVVPKLTSNSSSPIGKAFAESTYSNLYDAWYAFNQVDDSEGYASRSGYLQGHLGFYFYNETTIGKYGVRSVSAANLNKMPKDWTFEGSNDSTNGSDGTWVVLDTQTNQTWTTAFTTKEYIISNPRLFKWYRLKWTANNGYSSYTDINELLMYSYTPPEPAKPAMWKTVSTTLPSKDTFISEGMEDLSVLDRKLTTFNIPMDDNTASGEVLGKGRLFKEKISFDKLIEIKSIKIK